MRRAVEEDFFLDQRYGIRAMPIARRDLTIKKQTVISVAAVRFFIHVPSPHQGTITTLDFAQWLDFAI